MRSVFALAAFLSCTASAGAQEIVSAYTDLVVEDHCSSFAQAGENDGDWIDYVCTGYRGYPVLVSYADARESIFYGFPPASENERPWESFDAFNRAGPRIEWRIEKRGDVEEPFATIHRWFVSDPDDADEQIEVLVIEKVGQIGAWGSCAVGYVVATGNPDANDAARRIADGQARDFACGDQPVIDAASAAMPSFTRGGE